MNLVCIIDEKWIAIKLGNNVPWTESVDWLYDLVSPMPSIYTKSSNPIKIYYKI